MAVGLWEECHERVNQKEIRTALLVELNSANLLGPGLRRLDFHFVRENINISGFSFPLLILTDKSQV